jgi:hypothetical protein
MTHYNEQFGMQHQNIQRHSRYMTAQYKLRKKMKKKEDSIETGTDYEQPKAKDCLIQQHRNSTNSIAKKMTAFLQSVTQTESLTMRRYQQFQ